jgi:dienelactone hydrolase
MKRLLLSLLLSTGMLLNGCVGHRTPSHVRPVVSLPSALEAKLAYRVPASFEDILPPVRVHTTKHTFMQRIVRAGERTLSFDYFVPSSAGSHPALVILPVMGGTSYPLEHHFARYFADKGYVCAMGKRPNIKEEVQDFADIDRLLQHSVVDARLLCDFLSRQPEVDPNKLGLFGISFGAVRGTLVLGVDTRIKAGVLGMPGGDIPYILGHTTEKGLIRHREALLAKHSLTLEEGIQRVREHVTLDPLAVAPSIDPRKVLLILAAYDTVVPSATGQQLRVALGDPQTFVYPTGHYTIAGFLPAIKQQAYDFFEKRFREK